MCLRVLRDALRRSRATARERAMDRATLVFKLKKFELKALFPSRAFV